jgi:hypothetical protein
MGQPNSIGISDSMPNSILTKNFLYKLDALNRFYIIFPFHVNPGLMLLKNITAASLHICFTVYYMNQEIDRQVLFCFIIHKNQIFDILC